jgi:hypothetical protein
MTLRLAEQGIPEARSESVGLSIHKGVNKVTAHRLIQVYLNVSEGSF